MSTFTIEKLQIYPLKSGQSNALSKADIRDSGFQNDRICALVDENYTVLTAREQPKILSIKTEITKEGFQFSTENNKTKILNLASCSQEPIEAELFKESFQTSLIKHKINDWFSNILGEKCFLILNKPSHSRKIRHTTGDAPIALSDACPIHLINQESVNDLNKKLENKVKSSRFRPNILISRAAPYEEEQWKSVQIGACTFNVVLKTKRCSMITIDPKTCTKDPEQEPLRKLASYKRKENQINFGIYLVPTNHGTIRATDQIKVLY